MIDLIAFDADDTLWHNEPLYSGTAEKFTDLLAAYHDRQWILDRLYAAEMRNLKHFGYGVKSYALSMIETAIELSEGRITGDRIRTIVEFAKDMLAAPITLIAGAREAVSAIAATRRVIVVTKGDLFDQEAKIARSGLGELFSGVEVVTEKAPETYRRVLREYDVEPSRFLMVGDSLRSDILPVLDIGGHAVHVPYASPWKHELVSSERVAEYAYPTVDSIREVPGLIAATFGD